MNANATREDYLMRATDALRPRFAAAGQPLPDQLHISVGFPYGTSRENGRIWGQCWTTVASSDGVNHLFISPELGDTLRVLMTLAHELAHAALDNRDGHKGAFVELAKALGMCGPAGRENAFSQALPGPVFTAELITLAETLGDYPHGQLETQPAPVVATTTAPGSTITRTRAPRVHSGPARQTTRRVACRCPHCGYRAETSRAWLEYGTPVCPGGAPTADDTPCPGGPMNVS